MAARLDPPPRYRRAIFFYTIAIGGPTLILLLLGLQSVRRQQVAIDQLGMVNLRLSAEQLATALVERIDLLATTCLGDRTLVSAVETYSESPGRARQIRKTFDEARLRHPIADELFIVDGERVLFPALNTSHDRILEAPGDEGGRVELLLNRAEYGFLLRPVGRIQTEQ
jgi:hypothetical protein